MNKKLHLLFLSSTLSFGAFAQFQLTSQDWTIPVMEQYAEDLDQVNGLNYSLVDINGDGKADLVDARQNGATTVWMTSSNVPYWKVYLNNGSGFSAVAENWTIPVMEQYAEDLDQVNGANYSLVDINGDGKPDLVDARQNGATTVWMTSSNVPYWKVYKNTGT
ncbi:MAG: VCBS repeat-containing protein, partial [Flavobacteriia bacterium]|nr:VCBS repeat-containing protein [Flavobacteriia bacterium]